MSRFKEWIDDAGGAERVAKLCNLTGHSVRAWLRREAIPSPAHLWVLVRASKGRVTFQDIYKETKPITRKRKRAPSA